MVAYRNSEAGAVTENAAAAIFVRTHLLSDTPALDVSDFDSLTGSSEDALPVLTFAFLAG